MLSTTLQAAGLAQTQFGRINLMFHYAFINSPISSSYFIASLPSSPRAKASIYSSLVAPLTSYFHPAHKSDITFARRRLFGGGKMGRVARRDPLLSLRFNVPRLATCGSASDRTKEPAKRRLTSDTGTDVLRKLKLVAKVELESALGAASVAQHQSGVRGRTHHGLGRRDGKVSEGGGGVQISGRRCFSPDQD